MSDSHTHLVAPQIANSIDQMISSFIQKGGTDILNVSYTLESIYESLKLHEKYRNHPKLNLKTAIGLHPEIYYRNSDFKLKTTTFEQANKLLHIFEKILDENINKIGAIGETGLDYHEISSDSSLTQTEREECIEIQKISLRKHIQLAKKLNLPLTIHTRDAKGESSCIEDTVRILCEEGEGKVTGSFHSYTGEMRFLTEILNLGFYVGFNAITTYPSAENVRELLRATPLDRILLETDAPFLPTQSNRKDKNSTFKYAQPADIFEIADKVAEVKNIAVKRVLDSAQANFHSLFGSGNPL